MDPQRKKRYPYNLPGEPTEPHGRPFDYSEYLKRLFPNPVTREVYEAIAHGLTLCTPRDGLGGRLLNAPNRPPYGEERDVPEHNVSELLNSGMLAELPEHPTDRKTGWRALGLPGETWKCWKLIQ